MYVLYSNIANNLSINYFNTINECLNFVQTKPVKAYKYKPISEQLPMQFYFAFYWNDSIKDVDIDINIAKEIKKDEYRQLRDPLLQKLDVSFMKALEDDDFDKKQKIILAKNLLRNVTDQDLPNNWKDLLYYYPAIFFEVNTLI